MKYIKLSGKLYLTGPDGITRVETLGEWHTARKSGNNSEIYSSKGLIGAVKETIDEIELLLNPSPQNTRVDRNGFVRSNSIDNKED